MSERTKANQEAGRLSSAWLESVEGLLPSSSAWTGYLGPRLHVLLFFPLPTADTLSGLFQAKAGHTHEGIPSLANVWVGAGISRYTGFHGNPPLADDRSQKVGLLGGSDLAVFSPLPAHQRPP